jgi:hypothetical protein
MRLLLRAGAQPAQLSATEYSPTGRASLEALGVSVRSQDFRSDGVGEAKYDVVAMFQTLEHLDDLDATMGVLSRLTTRRGSVMISVPNVEEIDWYECHKGLLDMPPNHITAFSLRGLFALATRHGWQVVEYAQEPERLAGRVKRLAVQRALLRRQRASGIAGRVDSFSNPKLRRVAMVGIAAGELPASLAPAVTTRSRPGEAVWVHLRPRDQDATNM